VLVVVARISFWVSGGWVGADVGSAAAVVGSGGEVASSSVSPQPANKAIKTDIPNRAKSFLTIVPPNLDKPEKFLNAEAQRRRDAKDCLALSLRLSASAPLR
jgi:hypothetical protein